MSWEDLSKFLRNMGYGVTTNNGDRTEVVFKQEVAPEYPAGATPGDVRKASAADKMQPVPSLHDRLVRSILAEVGPTPALHETALLAALLGVLGESAL